MVEGPPRWGRGLSFWRPESGRREGLSVGSNVRCAWLLRVRDEFQVIGVSPQYNGWAAEGVVVNDEDVAGPAGAAGDEIEFRPVADRSEVLAGFIIRQAPSFTDIRHG